MCRWAWLLICVVSSSMSSNNSSSQLSINEVLRQWKKYLKNFKNNFQISSVSNPGPGLVNVPSFLKTEQHDALMTMSEHINESSQQLPIISASTYFTSSLGVVNNIKVCSLCFLCMRILFWKVEWICQTWAWAALVSWLSLRKVCSLSQHLAQPQHYLW